MTEPKWPPYVVGDSPVILSKLLFLVLKFRTIVSVA